MKRIDFLRGIMLVPTLLKKENTPKMELKSFSRGHGIYTAVSTDGRVMTSTNGINWIKAN